MMNLNGLRVTIDKPDDYDPDHASLRIASNAYHDPPYHVIPEDVPDTEYFAARIRAAGVLARIAALALLHIEAERRDHRCGGYSAGEPLTRQPGGWDNACQIMTFDLDPDGDGSLPVALYLYVPAKRAKAWATACKGWVAEVATQDTYTPPTAPVAWDASTPAPASVHQLRAGSAS